MQNRSIFTSFSPKLFLTIFLVKSKLSTAKKSKTAAYSRHFTQNNTTISSVIFENSNFCPNIQFLQNLQFFSGNQSCQQLKCAKSQHFHEFSPKFFLTIFLVKSQLLTATKSKTTAFSRVFTQHNSTIFLGKSKLNFRQQMKILNIVRGNQRSTRRFCRVTGVWHQHNWIMTKVKLQKRKMINP